MTEHGKMVTGRTILKTIQLLATGIAFGAQLLNSWAGKKEDEIAMKEAVQKEIARQQQMLIPMKATEKRDP